MAESRGLLASINRAFLLQGLLIAVASVLSVYFAKIVIEEILIKNAIIEEHDYYWAQHNADPAFPLPDTKNLTGYSEAALLPREIDRPPPSEAGFYEFGQGDDRIVLHVSHDTGKTLYLVYYRGQVDALVLYYGIFPLIMVLMVLYLSLWLTYRFSRRTLSPIIRLANEIDNLDLNQPELPAIGDFDGAYESEYEIQVLADALSHLGERLNDFTSRERNFTRDASHELRSPLTVINIAADMLLSEQDLPPQAYKSVERIKRSISDMLQLIEVFLLLARENEQALTREEVSINGILQDEIMQARMLNPSKPVELRYRAGNELQLDASERVLRVLFGNLIRNALLYTDQGEVVIEVSGQRVTIADSGPGMERQQIETLFQPFIRGRNVNASGHGIGLTIVKRLSDRFDWPITVHSEVSKGSRFDIEFPQAIVAELGNDQAGNTPRLHTTAG